MLDDRRVLAVVPARGGSKGVRLKNIREINGVPLVGMVGQVVQEIAIIDRAVVSTDHDEIARVAQDYGLEAPFRRPEDLSGDRIGDVDVLTHALRATEEDDGRIYDVIVMLQPTAPLRRPEHVTATITKLLREGFDAVWTVSQSDSKYHPLKQLRVRGSELSYFENAGAEIIARQQLDTLHTRNGVAYALTRECLLDQGVLMGRRTGAVCLDGHFVSIDTEWDFRLTEFVLGEIERG
jgi:CMP-N-acetylneuraminic acid synthetase